MSHEPLSADNLPVPSKRSVGKPTALKREKKKMGTEMAAMAYVAMENGDWVYAPGTRRQYDGNGNIVPNKAECMRRAGYRGQSVEMFNKYLQEDDYFWEMVELYRIRRTDPNFHADKQKDLWREIGGDSLRALYEKVRYYPHSVPTADHIKILKLVLDAGLAGIKLSDHEEGRSDKLLDSISDPAIREKAMAGYKAQLEREQKRVEALEKAHKGAEHEQA